MFPLTIFALSAGYMAATQPSGAGWRFFSYHPMLMTLGWILCMGNASLVKKLGGYSNTKTHGILAFVGSTLSWLGFYVIYKNKDQMGKPHFATYHAIGGMVCLVGSSMIGAVGSVFLHPDFGIDKTNKTIRFAHKTSARVLLFMAWLVAFSGLATLTTDTIILGLFGVPLLAFAPFILL